MQNSNKLHPGNHQNDVDPQAPRHYSTLNLSRRMHTTQRFGVIGVTRAFESVPADNVPLYSAHNIMSMSLSDRLMSDVYLKKDWFQVPRRAVLPENFDKILKAPPFGDDVPSDANTSVSNFSLSLSAFFYSWWNNESLNDVAPDTTMFPKWVKFLTCLQYFYSYGSLVSALGASFERFFSFDGLSLFVQPDGVTGMRCDQFVDTFWNYFVTKVSLMPVTLNGSNYLVYTGSAPEFAGGSNYISLRRLLELIHDDPSQTFTVSASTVGLQDFVDDIASEFNGGTLNIAYDEAPYDLIYTESYQMCCAHFYSNESIDPVYSADIYRQVVYSVFRDYLSFIGGNLSTNGFFLYNGVQTPYDALSSHVFTYLIVSITGSGASFSQRRDFMLRYFSTVFAWRNSLRFMDYFTGGRTNPLSIGNVDIAVSGNKVNVIDVITNTQKARFLNFCNRSKRQLEGYYKDLTGKAPSHDWHNPLWLGHQEDVVYTVETENTGDAQLDPNGAGRANSITSRFQSKSSGQYGFEVEVDEDSVLIGLNYFDIPRAYAHATDRMYFQKDRYDWFNEFMQTIGDQKLFWRELSDISVSSLAWDFPFAYKLRHAEFKESYDICKGALASGKLPGFVFTDDQPTRGIEEVINESFIRSSSTELDPFFLALTGYSLANYYHFLVTYYNDINARRNMIVAPTLL